MKKFVTLFTDSARELKSVRTITTMAMLAAVAVILGYFSIEYGQFIRIGFSGIPNGIVDYLFGPVAGAVFHGAQWNASYGKSTLQQSQWPHPIRNQAHEAAYPK
jgi:thiamine transporter ThiT